MNKQEWKTLAKVMLVSMLAVAVLLGLSLWLLLYVNRDGHAVMSFEAVLNLIVVALLALMFPLIHHGQARWLWHTQDMAPGQAPEWMSQKTAPLPKIVKPWPQRLLEAVLQLAAMLLLLWLFGPYATQQYLVDWTNAYQLSSGTYLLCVMVLGSVPIGALALLVHGVLRVCARRCDTDSLRYRLWRVWLWAYVLAFACCVYIILMLGMMMVRYLE
ncbi:hypothetical protein LVJ82_14910 [Vitreoscilla massiliensis]|uniref:Uncharacterized protein n=1 Tax=Vitreoscilla massiliensis TaxID=1689272 RepID=A0ABY4DYY5_9NEIS|nr:hypothetical protein [Vitreoscilla massiliensis]UOO88735.1 hypothetical protein LVJ82_14910 [Vitreoscilla massiliensis]